MSIISYAIVTRNKYFKLGSFILKGQSASNLTSTLITKVEEDLKELGIKPPRNFEVSITDEFVPYFKFNFFLNECGIFDKEEIEKMFDVYLKEKESTQE